MNQRCFKRQISYIKFEIIRFYLNMIIKRDHYNDIIRLR